MADASASTSSSSNNNSIIKSFTTTLHRFIVTLSDTFPECDKTKDKVKLFELAVLNSEPMQKMMIEKWHENFKPLYSLADKRDMKGILDSKFWILEEIDFVTKWNDAGLTDEDRQNIWMYLDFLNGNARVYAAVPSKLQTTLEKTANDLGDINLQSLNNLDLTEMLKMTQKMVSNLSENDIKELTSNMGSIMEGLGGFDGILQFGQRSGLFGALFPNIPTGGTTPSSTAGGSSDTSTPASSPIADAIGPFANILKGTLDSALQSLTGSADPSTPSTSSAPAIPAELETMFANIGQSLLSAASTPGASASPLENILKSLQQVSTSSAGTSVEGGARESKSDT